MPSDEPDQIEIQVIVDVLEAVESALRDRERHGWHPTVPRSRIYAIILHSVILSARAHSYRSTLDAADILDTIFDGTAPSHPTTSGQPIEDTIRKHTVQAN